MDPGETCDDGNSLSGDGCSADCSTVEDGFSCPVAGEPCVPETCIDTVQNGDETDIDCGGSSCPQCSAGKTCNENADCLSDSCVAGTCTTN